MQTRVTTTLPCEQFTVGDGNWSDSSQRGPVHSIVLHTMVGTVAGTNARFNTPNIQVSAHYGIGLDGKLYQWCDEDNVAYHAGDWLINQTSIGIEHEDGTNPNTNPQGYNNPRPDALYEMSAKLVAEICRFYDFPADEEHIFRHEDVIDKTVYKGGTACPDALDTKRIIRMAAEILNPPAPSTTPVEPIKPEEAIPTPPVETPSVPVETPQVTQVDTIPVANTPEQTTTTPVETTILPSGQVGKVPFTVQNPISTQTQSKLTFWQVIVSLIIFILHGIGIERKTE